MTVLGAAGRMSTEVHDFIESLDKAPNATQMMVSLSTLCTLCYCCPCRLVSPFAYSVCSLWMVTTELSLLVTLQVVTVAHYSCWQPIADGAIVSSFTLIFWQAEIAGGPEQWLQSAPKLLQTLISKVRMSCCFPAATL